MSRWAWPAQPQRHTIQANRRVILRCWPGSYWGGQPCSSTHRCHDTCRSRNLLLGNPWRSRQCARSWRLLWVQPSLPHARPPSSVQSFKFYPAPPGNSEAVRVDVSIIPSQTRRSDMRGPTSAHPTKPGGGCMRAQCGAPTHTDGACNTGIPTTLIATRNHYSSGRTIP